MQAIKKHICRQIAPNYLFGHPAFTGVILSLFLFLFTIIYRPLGTTANPKFGYVLTMALYAIPLGFCMWAGTLLINRIPWFSKSRKWHLCKELVALIFMLFWAGIVVYFLAFFIEPPADRWNMATFIDSCRSAALVGIIPYGAGFLFNLRKAAPVQPTDNSSAEEKSVRINSKLKKESLRLYPSQLLYVEADGNYVIFHMLKEQKREKQILRNSISDIANQLSNEKKIVRTHRAFLVNLGQVTAVTGNSAGYQLKVTETKELIPVARTQAKHFREEHPELFE